MKIVKPTFEKLIAETDDIYVRYENINGVKMLVAGGINKNGMWLEFPFRLSENASVSDITRSLKVIAHILHEKNKRWHIESRYQAKIREIGTNPN